MFAGWNPLDARLGAGVLIHDIDFRAVPFLIDAVQVSTEDVDGRLFAVTDYDLRCVAERQETPNPLADADGVIRRRLRMQRTEEPDALSDCDILLLEMIYEAPWQQAEADGVQAALADPQGLFRDGETEYRRRFGDVEPHEVRVKSTRGTDWPDVVCGGLAGSGTGYYRDYERATDDGRTEYLIVEEDPHAIVRIFRGYRLPQEAVMCTG